MNKKVVIGVVVGVLVLIGALAAYFIPPMLEAQALAKARAGKHADIRLTGKLLKPTGELYGKCLASVAIKTVNVDGSLATKDDLKTLTPEFDITFKDCTEVEIFFTMGKQQYDTHMTFKVTAPGENVSIEGGTHHYKDLAVTFPE